MAIISDLSTITQWSNIIQENNRVIFEDPRPVEHSSSRDKLGTIMNLRRGPSNVTLCVDGIPIYKVRHADVEFRRGNDFDMGMVIREEVRLNAVLEEIHEEDYRFKIFKSPGIDPVGFAW